MRLAKKGTPDGVEKVPKAISFLGVNSLTRQGPPNRRPGCGRLKLL